MQQTAAVQARPAETSAVPAAPSVGQAHPAPPPVLLPTQDMPPAQGLE
jgi:hypothetical protein